MKRNEGVITWSPSSTTLPTLAYTVEYLYCVRASKIDRDDIYKQNIFFYTEWIVVSEVFCKIFR